MHDADDLAHEVVGAAAAASATISAAEAGAAADAARSSTELADDAVRDDSTAESAARLASWPLAPLLALAVMLGAWEAAPARYHAEVIAVRERLVTVLRDLVHLHIRGVPQPHERPVEWPVDLERGDVAEVADSAQTARDESGRLPADARGEAELHPEPPVQRAYLQGVGSLGWSQTFCATWPTTGAERDGDDRGGHDSSGDDFNSCAASATPRGPRALGSLGAGPSRLVMLSAQPCDDVRLVTSRAEDDAAGLTRHAAGPQHERD